MRVAVIREKKIQNIILNDATEGSYWVTETDSNGKIGRASCRERV